MRATAGGKLLAAAEASIGTEQAALAAVADRLAAAQQAPADQEPSTEERDRLAAAATAARAAEMEARLALRSARGRTDRRRRNRAASLERAAETERRARIEAAERARHRQFQARKAAAVGHGVERLLASIDMSLELAAHERDAAEEVRAAGIRNWPGSARRTGSLRWKWRN